MKELTLLSWKTQVGEALSYRAGRDGTLGVVRGMGGDSPGLRDNSQKEHEKRLRLANVKFSEWAPFPSCGAAQPYLGAGQKGAK